MRLVLWRWRRWRRGRASKRRDRPCSRAYSVSDHTTGGTVPLTHLAVAQALRVSLQLLLLPLLLLLQWCRRRGLQLLRLALQAGGLIRLHRLGSRLGCIKGTAVDVSRPTTAAFRLLGAEQSRHLRCTAAVHSSATTGAVEEALYVKPLVLRHLPHRGDVPPPGRPVVPQQLLPGGDVPQRHQHRQHQTAHGHVHHLGQGGAPHVDAARKRARVLVLTPRTQYDDCGALASAYSSGRARRQYRALSSTFYGSRCQGNGMYVSGLEH